MKIDWDVPIRMGDGLVLRADVFRPEDGKHPALLSYGPYGKGLAFQDLGEVSLKGFAQPVKVHAILHAGE